MSKISVKIKNNSLRQVTGEFKQVLKILEHFGCNYNPESDRSPLNLDSLKEEGVKQHYESTHSPRDNWNKRSTLTEAQEISLFEVGAASRSYQPEEIHVILDKEYPTRDFIINNQIHSVSNQSFSALDDSSNYFVQTFVDSNTIAFREPSDKINTLNNLQPHSDKKLIITINAALSGHCVDAINIKCSNIEIRFASGFIENRSHKDKFPRQHPDSIQIIPKNSSQFYGGALHNITIAGNSGSGYQIDSFCDDKQQGILGSDGRFHNLNINSLNIRTKHPIGIHFNGMLSGVLENINLAGEATIALYPIRIGGGCNIFIQSLANEEDPYEDLYVNNVTKNGSPYSVTDLRKISDSSVRSQFIAQKSPDRIYANFPLDQFYETIMLPQNTYVRNYLRNLNPLNKDRFIAFCDNFANSNGASITHS